MIFNSSNPSFTLKKLIFLIILGVFSTQMKAEHFFDFYLHNLDLTAYPKIKVRGAVMNYVITDQFFEGKPFPDHIALFENNNELQIDVSLKYINENIHFFNITYTTELPKEDAREFLLKYNQNGFHNGSEGQRFEYSPLGINNIRELAKRKEFDAGPKYVNEALGTYLNNLILDYDANGLQEMYVIARNGLLVRKAPKTSSKVIGKLDFGQVSQVSIKQYGQDITVTENKELNLDIKGQFRQINYKGKKGYVFDGYLTSLYYLNKTENACSYMYSEQETQERSENNRAVFDYEDQFLFLEFKFIPQQESYLLAQAIFGDLKTFEVSNQVFNGHEYTEFKNTDYMFRLLSYGNSSGYSGDFRIYFKCFD